MVIDPAEFSDEELETYLQELFRETEELNASRITIRVKDDVVHLSGFVPTREQLELAQILVLDVVPEDRLANDLHVEPEVEAREEEPPDEPVPEVPEEPAEVEDEDWEAASQSGKTYEPPVVPRPEPKHEKDW